MQRCPSHDQLRRLLEEESDAPDQPAIQDHVRACASCQETLTELSDATEVDRWRRVLRLDQQATPDAEEQLHLERLLKELKSHPPSHTDVLGSLPQHRLGNYELLEQLGEGGMGVVFKARHQRMDRVVALKILSRTITTSPDAVARFRREVKTAARLSHPSIVTAFDADEVEGLHFLVMEYVEGCDLARHVKAHGPLGIEQAVRVVLEAARGLQYAHAMGIIHRDIKPSNLMLTDQGRESRKEDLPESDSRRATLDAQPLVKILDMGLAGLQAAWDGGEDQESASVGTQSGAVMGTADYMSPEQALETKTADARSDIYSLGCTLYFLLTGKSPYGGSSFTQRIVAHREQPVPSLTQGCAGVPKRLDAVFRKMVAKQAAARYGSMGEVIDALSPFAEPPDDRSKVDLPHRKSRSRKVAGLLAAAGILLLVVFATRAPRAWLERERSPSLNSPEQKAPQQLEPRWEAGPAQDVIPGIIPRPASLAGVDRWQVETVSPRGKVLAADWSPDGRRIAFAGLDRQIRVYDADSFRLVQLLAGHTAGVGSLDWHPTLPRLASGAHDGTVRVWNLDTGFELDQFRHARIRQISEVKWSPHGDQLAIAGDDTGSRVYLWTPGTAQPITLSGHALSAQCVGWSPDGTRLATGGRDRTVRIWTADGNLEHTSGDLGHALLSVAWHPDGFSIAAAGRDQRIQLLNPDTTVAMQLDGPNRGAIALAWSRDGRRLAAGGLISDTNSSVHVWDRDGTPVSAFDAGPHVESIAWSPDGERLAVGGWEIRSAVWGVRGGRLGSIGDTADMIMDLAWNQDGTQLAVATTWNTVRVWHDDGLQTATLTADSANHLRAVDWLSDGTLVAAYLTPRGTLVYWPQRSAHRQTTVFPDQDAQLIDLAVRAGDGRLAMAQGPVIRLVPPEGGPGEFAADGAAIVCQLAWHPHDSSLAAKYADGTIRLWDQDRPPHELLRVRPAIYPSIAWHAEGALLSVGDGSKLWLVDVTSQDTTSIDTPYGAIESLAWNSGGILASAHEDGVIGFWDDEGALQQTLAAYGYRGGSIVGWHPDDRRLAVGGQDKLLRVWDAVSGELVWTAVLLPGGKTVTLDAGGALLHGEFEGIDEHLVYLVDSNGSRQLVRPTQFRNSL